MGGKSIDNFRTQINLIKVQLEQDGATATERVSQLKELSHRAQARGEIRLAKRYLREAMKVADERTLKLDKALCQLNEIQAELHAMLDEVDEPREM